MTAPASPREELWNTIEHYFLIHNFSERIDFHNSNIQKTQCKWFPEIKWMYFIVLKAHISRIMFGGLSKVAIFLIFMIGMYIKVYQYYEWTWKKFRWNSRRVSYFYGGKTLVLHCGNYCLHFQGENQLYSIQHIQIPRTIKRSVMSFIFKSITRFNSSIIIIHFIFHRNHSTEFCIIYFET